MALERDNPAERLARINKLMRGPAGIIVALAEELF